MQTNDILLQAVVLFGFPASRWETKHGLTATLTELAHYRRLPRPGIKWEHHGKHILGLGVPAHIKFVDVAIRVLDPAIKHMEISRVDFALAYYGEFVAEVASGQVGIR